MESFSLLENGRKSDGFSGKAVTPGHIKFLLKDEGDWNLQARSKKYLFIFLAFISFISGCIFQSIQGNDPVLFGGNNCVAGTYSTASDCTKPGTDKVEPCPAGKSSLPNSKNAGDCKDCTAGQYSVKGTVATLCTVCAAGLYGETKAGGLTTAECSGKCVAGTFGASGRTTKCTDLCAVGKFSLVQANQCTNCPAGRYGGATGLKTEKCSGICNKGTYSSAAAEKCTKCPAGTFGRSVRFSSDGLKTDNCSGKCSAGTFSLEGAISCTACPAGSYGATSGLTSNSCSGSCITGEYSVPGSIVCTNQCPGAQVMEDEPPSIAQNDPAYWADGTKKLSLNQLKYIHSWISSRKLVETTNYCYLYQGYNYLSRSNADRREYCSAITNGNFPECCGQGCSKSGWECSKVMKDMVLKPAFLVAKLASLGGATLYVDMADQMIDAVFNEGAGIVDAASSAVSTVMGVVKQLSANEVLSSVLKSVKFNPSGSAPAWFGGSGLQGDANFKQNAYKANKYIGATAKAAAHEKLTYIEVHKDPDVVLLAADEVLDTAEETWLDIIFKFFNAKKKLLEGASYKEGFFKINIGSWFAKRTVKPPEAQDDDQSAISCAEYAQLNQALLRKNFFSSTVGVAMTKELVETFGADSAAFNQIAVHFTNYFVLSLAADYGLKLCSKVVKYYDIVGIWDGMHNIRYIFTLHISVTR